jgi:hypothetical protein
MNFASFRRFPALRRLSSLLAMPGLLGFGGLALAVGCSATDAARGEAQGSTRQALTEAGAPEPFHTQRPFWVMGHNPNSKASAEAFLKAGANALEPDVMAWPSKTCAVQHTGLAIAHDPECNASPTELIQYLKDLSSLADTYSLGLIVFDVKSQAAAPDNAYAPTTPYAQQLVDAVHDNIMVNHPDMRIVFSVGTTDDAVFFNALHFGNGETPYGAAGQVAIQIDGNNYPDINLYGLRTSYPNAGGFGFGDGTALCCDRTVGPNTPASLDEALWLRAGYGKIDLIPYAFTVTHRNAEKMFLGQGVDGLITDDDAWLKAEVQTRSDVCYAMDTGCDPWDPNPANDPKKRFLPRGALQGYALAIKTADYYVLHDQPGTDAYVTFTVVGKNGRASATVDGSFPHRFELDIDAVGGVGGVDYVYIHSADLGVLDHVEVTQDGSGGSLAANGAASTMNLEWVRVRSAQYMGVEDASESIAYIDRTDRLDDNVTRSAHLTSRDTTPPTITAAVIGAQPNAAGWYHTNVTVHFTCTDNDGGSGVRAEDCPVDQVLSAEAAAVSSTAQTVKDGAGNVSAKSNVVTVKIDKTAPSLQCATADGQWHATDVTLACTSSDALSGLATPADASFGLTTSVAVATDNANALTSSHPVSDVASNMSTAGPIGGNKIDKKVPDIAIVQPAATQYTHSATLTLNYSVTDSGSGVATITTLMDGSATVAGSGLASGQAFPLLTSLPLGTHVFTVMAVDAVGNMSPIASITFTIIVTAQSMIDDVTQFQSSGAVASTVASSLLAKLNNAKASQAAGRCGPAAHQWAAFMQQVRAQSGKSITPVAADILLADAQYLSANCH